MPQRPEDSSSVVIDPVPAAGVVALLHGCNQLQSLHLKCCVGPFTDDLGRAAAGRRPIMKLRDLQIVDCGHKLSGVGWRQLFGG